MKRILPAGVLIVTLLAAVIGAPAVHAGPGDAGADSVYLIGEFVDPVCIYQHGMQGLMQRKCAMVRGRVEQGMFFLDIRERKLYTVIGQTHWEDPKQGFLASLGDTFAVRGKIWRYADSRAIAITAAYPYRSQPEPVYRAWPWSWEWSVLAGCGVLALLHLLAITRWRRALGGGDAPVKRWRVVSFVASIAFVLVSLNGPLHDLSDRYLFSAHMVQHLILAQVFPLLFVLGIPAWLWRALLRPRVMRVLWNAVTSVPVGFALYTTVFSIWHVPFLYDLMMRDHGFHIVMHLLVMGTAVTMWWPIVGGNAVARPLAPGSQMLYLFLLGVPMMAVAAMVTFTQRPLYEWYALAPRFMGISALEDQRLGGLLMWVPGGLFYWMIMSIVYFRWAGTERRPDSPMVIGRMPGRTT